MSVPVDTGKYGRPSIVNPEALAAHGLESGAYATVPPPSAAILCYHRGLTPPQAADVLGIPIGTLKSRLHAALTELRTDLQRTSRTPATKKAATP